MAIVTDQYVLYDNDLHYYYLSEAGAEHYTGKQHISSLWSNPQWRLKDMGRMIYDLYTTSAYNGQPPRYRALDHAEYKVFKDTQGQRDAIIRALTLFAIMADDMDLDIDVRAGEKEMPQSIINVLVNGNVYFRGKYCGYIDEDEWRVGY